MKTIEELRDAYEKGYWGNGRNDARHRNGIQAVADAVAPRWISVEERLPENKDQWLLVCDGPDGAMVTMAWWKMPTGNYGWKQLNHCEHPNLREECVTHWMPLPDAPKIPPI